MPFRTAWEQLTSEDPPCKITDVIYLGSTLTEQDIKILESTGITHILQVANDVDKTHTNKFKYLQVQIADFFAADLLSHLEQGLHFIKMAANSNGKVLVHCRAGVSRSTSVCIAWLMQSERIGYDEALSKVRESRPWVHPNMGFEAQLRMFETCSWDLKAAETKWLAFKQSSMDDQETSLWSRLIQSQGMDPTLVPAETIQESIRSELLSA